MVGDLKSHFSASGCGATTNHHKDEGYESWVTPDVEKGDHFSSRKKPK
jgi:hypothetical protein